jgi:phage terminase small subunit
VFPWPRSSSARVPTIQSTRAPGEPFAKIGAHLVLDPRARQSLAPEVVACFDRQVFNRPQKADDVRVE